MTHEINIPYCDGITSRPETQQLKQGNDDSEETVVKKPSRNDFAFDHELKK